MIRDAARDFADAEVAPGAAERDKTQEFPIAQFKAAAAQGFTGVMIPEEFGGKRASATSAGVAHPHRGQPRRAASDRGSTLLGAQLAVLARPW